MNSPLFWAVNMFALSTFPQQRPAACLHPANCRLLQEKTPTNSEENCSVLFSLVAKTSTRLIAQGMISPSILVGWQTCLCVKGCCGGRLIDDLNLNVVTDSVQGKWKAQVCYEDEGSS